jgi:Bacterial membrane protein YfhO
VDDLFKSPKAKTFLAFVALCLAAAVLFWPVFFQGKVIVPGDIPNSNPFLFIGDTPPPPPQNTLLSDEIEQFYVWHRVAADSLRNEGHIPLWNPYIFTGQPLVADGQSSLFYPPNLLLRVLSPGNVATLRVFFNLLFAGFFTYLFCREVRVSHRGALLSALTFSFSGPLIVWVGFPLANVLACLPFLMWGGEKLLVERTISRVAMLGTGMGISLLAGHPETTFQILAIFSIYFMARVLLQVKGLRRRGGLVGAFLLAVILGAVISGIQLLPFLDFMVQSATFARGGRGTDLGGSFLYSQEWLANIATAVTLVCPNFFGNPLDHSYVWPFTNFQNYNEQAVYFGLAPLTLAAGALFGGPKPRQLMIITILALFCIGVAWHLPGFEAINHLPVFSMAPGKRFRLPFVFLTAVMAGFGYDSLLDRLKSGRIERKGFYASVALLLATILLFLSIFILKGTVADSIPAGTFWHKILHSVFGFGQWKTHLPLVIAIALFSGYLIARRSQRACRLFPNALLFLTVFELCALGWGYNPTVKEADILPSAPAVEFLKKREREPYRILTTDGYFYPNYGAAYGIADVAGYDAPVYQSFSDLYLGQGGRSFGGQIDSRQLWEPNWPLVDFLNVRYVISPRDLPPDKFRMLFENRFFAIYENLRALPRAFVVYESEVVPDRRALLDRMLSRKVDFGSKVLLDEALEPLPAGAAGGTAGHAVQHSSFTTDEVVLQVDSKKPGLLVMSDLYTPDWRALVDDREVKLYRANYAFRAVPVPEGRHTVKFRYSPLSYRAGKAMTFFGMVAALIMVAGKSIMGRGRKSS